MVRDGVTEEQLMQIFSEVGRVLHVRMALNAENGRPKGYAFIEYEDPAASFGGFGGGQGGCFSSSPSSKLSLSAASASSWELDWLLLALL